MRFRESLRERGGGGGERMPFPLIHKTTRPGVNLTEVPTLPSSPARWRSQRGKSAECTLMDGFSHVCAVLGGGLGWRFSGEVERG